MVATRTSTDVVLNGVSRRFGRTWVLDDINLQCGPGVIGLLGPNGAGKTTLLRVLATVLKPSRGDVSLLGHSLRDSPGLRSIRRDLGYLPQQFGYYPNFTVFEFVEYFALLKEMEWSTVRPAVAEAIAAVGLEDRATSKMKTLSGGMLRRAGIAQAIVNRPRLLLLDEPTVGLDPEQRLSFRELIRDLGEESTVFVSTHLVEDVASACSDVCLMADGRIIFRGTPDALIDRGLANGDRAAGSEIERGYTALLAAHRQQGGAR